jgi:LAS superfamily LD-carboxypeptidase LdcB
VNVDIIFGKTKENLVLIEGTKFYFHPLALTGFLRLQKDAAFEGFDLQIASAFRDYSRQLLIWNAKAKGERPLFDDQGKELNLSLLSPKEIMFSILRWSALPGCSRHHWGTDIDVFDAKNISSKDLKLNPAEYENNGPCSALSEWLSKKMLENEAHGFYRPYKTDRGGVSPEAWHLSYHPVARRITDQFTFSLFKKNLQEGDFLLKKELLENAEEIYHRFVMNFDLP